MDATHLVASFSDLEGVAPVKTMGSRLRRRKLTPVLLAVAVAGALVAPLSGTAHAAITELNVTDEDQDAPVNTNEARVQATITVDTPQTVDTFIDFELTGPGDLDGDTPETPDETCTIPVGDADGTCAQRFSSGEEGLHEVMAWVDEDNNNATVEADTAEEIVAGDTDLTDVVGITFFRPYNGGLNCSPERSTAEPGSDVSFTCRVSPGQAGWSIDGENMSGPNDQEPGNEETADYDDACVTGAGGSCQITVDGSAGDTGSANVCFWVDDEEDLSFHPAEGRYRDGGECDEESPTPDEANLTDVVVAGWGVATNATVTGPKIKKYGARLAVSGTVNSADASCEGGAEVRIQRDVLGNPVNFVNWKADRTGANGAYRVTAKADKSATYRVAVFDADPCLGTTSKGKTIRVAKKLTISGPKAVGRGQIARITGKIAPCKGHKGDRVTLLQKKGGKFRTVKHARSNNKCVAAFSVRINKTKTFKVKAGKTEAWLQGGTSRAKKVRAL
jgi:hypothetical protein